MTSVLLARRQETEAQPRFIISQDDEQRLKGAYTNVFYRSAHNDQTVAGNVPVSTWK